MVFRQLQEGTGGVRHKFLRRFGSTSSHGKLPEQIQQQKQSALPPQHQETTLPPTLFQHQKGREAQPPSPSQSREVGFFRMQQHRPAVPPAQPRQAGSFRTRQHQKRVLQPLPSSQPEETGFEDQKEILQPALVLQAPGAGSSLTQLQQQEQIQQPVPPSHPRETAPCSLHHRHLKDASKPHQEGASHIWSTALTSPNSPGKRSTQLRQEVLSSRQEKLEDHVAPHEPYPGTSYRSLLKEGSVGQLGHQAGVAQTLAGQVAVYFQKSWAGPDDPAAPHEPSPGASYRSLRQQRSVVLDGMSGTALGAASESTPGAASKAPELAPGATFGAAPGDTFGAEVLDRPCRKSMDCRSQAANLKSSESHLADITDEPTQHSETRETVAQFLMLAVHDGRLEGIISDIEQNVVQHASSSIHKCGAHLLAQVGASTQQDSSCGLREQAANLLVQAIQNGSLESIVSELEEVTRQSELKSTQGIPTNLFNVEVDHDGCLETRLSRMRETTQTGTSGVREICSELLMQAIHDGRLECILETLEEATLHISDDLPAGGPPTDKGSQGRELGEHSHEHQEGSLLRN
eukprot:TRINITY_DN3788_c0_g1_i1.p1 TRINITY_DN3788_c0_g1~~TRINITY_DN3788_c0_g1_i1.p1  ORF type:complete len:575 (+),score=104.97 TRINITY_DN3788_c0_g1_i1:126-1850(+)